MNFKVSLLLFVPILKPFYENYESVENMELQSNLPMKSHSLFLFENIKSLLNQNFSDLEILLFSNEKDYISNLVLDILGTDYEVHRFRFAEIDYNSSYKDIILASLELCSGEYLCPINILDVIDHDRIINQLNLIESKNLNIVSSLELPYPKEENTSFKENMYKPNFTDSQLSFTCSDYNKFISSNDIDFACLSSYIPLDLYTFMIRKSFIAKLRNILLKKRLENDLHLVLFLISYTQIEKANNAFTYIRFPRIPYEENKHIDNSLLSTNVISLFNRYKTIENRSFLIETLDKYHSSKTLKDVETTFKANNNETFNILIPIKELNIGGTETYILSICKELKKYNIKSYILTNGGILEDTFILNNIDVIKINHDFSKKVSLDEYFDNSSTVQCEKEDSLSYEINILRDVIEQYNIDILYCHGPTEFDLCCELKKSYSIPILATIHGTFYEKETILKAAACFESMIFVSKMSFLKYKDTIKDFNQDKFHIVPNSIDIKEANLITKPRFLENTVGLNYLNTLLEKIDFNDISSIDNKVPKILTYCSRLSIGKAKLALLFLKIFEELLDTNADIYALVIGDGREKSKITEYANKINSKYGTKVFVLGSIENVDYFYKKSFAVIGTGRVALEALSLGTPVFALGLSGYSGFVSNRNINNLIDSNFGDHINTSYTFKSFNSSTECFKYELNKFLFTSEYPPISKWCENYVKEYLKIDIISNKISNIIRNIFDFKL